MLIQAQPRRRDQETLTVEVVEKCLLEEHNIPALPFLQRLVKHLIEERNIPIEVLIRNKYALKDAAEKKIDSHRQNVHQAAYESFLLPECATPIVVSPDHCFSFEPHDYPYNTRYTGHYQFQKHYHPDVGDLKSKGEEFQCAQFIDTLSEVKFWVRNLERKPRSPSGSRLQPTGFIPILYASETMGVIWSLNTKGYNFGLLAMRKKNVKSVSCGRHVVADSVCSSCHRDPILMPSKRNAPDANPVT